MDTTTLVSVTKYSSKIRELPVTKRINVDYPLLCRDEVAKKLAEVADKLPPHLNLQIDSAYRTLKTQHILWESRKGVIGNLVHDPENGVSPHTTGGAVDISLTDTNGKELNLSEPFTKYYEEPKLMSEKISPKAQELRLLMNKLMLEVGFAPNPREYWHFSFGDQMWSDFYNKTPIYEPIELNEDQKFLLLKRVFFKAFRKMWKLYIKTFAVQTNY